jgi:orotate phosphoribosyltransferase
MLSENQSRFLDVLLGSGALRFGTFKTKSGRMSPFFLNSGAFDHGALLQQVAQCYAALIIEFIKSTRLSDVHLYGPAYKGITLAAAAAMETARITGREVPFTFNRKEVKDHGEGGTFVGRKLTPESKVLIVEDVMTGGTSVRETIDILRPVGAKICGVLIGVDRMERGLGSERASREISGNFSVPVHSILTIDEIVDALWKDCKPVERLGKVWITSELKSEIDRYRSEWGS